MAKAKKGRANRKSEAIQSNSDDKKSSTDRAKHRGSGQATRETVESVVVAVILAFLFRAFLAEAFVIPTGSMAPTLQGRHKDVECNECHYWYRVGASGENEFRNRRHEAVISTTCPICRHTMTLDLEARRHWSFSGDRILVSKFSYDLSDPKRWDVIVFKYPGNAVQNYIKRLVGLPNETVRIYGGDVYIKKKDEDDFKIARKPDRKLETMLQLVDDSSHIAPPLKAAGWQRWRPWSAQEDASSSWEHDTESWSWHCSGSSDADVMLRYHHMIPSSMDWKNIRSNAPLDPPLENRNGQLIADFYAYNAGVSIPHHKLSDYPTVEAKQAISGVEQETMGHHWVGDLAIESGVEVIGSRGELLLVLVEAGVKFQCRIDVVTGQAKLEIVNADFGFDDAEAAPTAATSVVGPGTYRLRFANVDDELRLWVNDRVISFDRSTTYSPLGGKRPVWKPDDPGDLAPLGIGSRGLELKVNRLKVLRDIYYIALDAESQRISDYQVNSSAEDLQRLFASPQRWETAREFDKLHSVEFVLEDDQFFPMGDNSPQSSDARIWARPLSEDPAPHHYVRRDLLIGKAVLIYWPHHWYEPIPFWPNFGRMGFIR